MPQLKISYLTDEDVINAADGEFIPDYDLGDPYFDKNDNLAKGGLFDPNVFGKTDIIPVQALSAPNVILHFGSKSAYYKFGKPLFNPMMVMDLLVENGFEEEIAYQIATCCTGISKKSADGKRSFVSVGNPACELVGADAFKYLADEHGIEYNPEALKMSVILIIPPYMRPLCEDHGSYSISDVNKLYADVISRDVRYTKLMDLNAPPVIILNERRMLYETIMKLMNNEWTPNPLTKIHDDSDKFMSLAGCLHFFTKESNRNIIRTALRISTNNESTVRQIRIDKHTLDTVDKILKDSNTNFSEIVRILMQEIANTGEIPAMFKQILNEKNVTAEEKLFAAIFGPQNSRHMGHDLIRAWGKSVGLPELSDATLKELFDSGLFPKDVCDGPYTKPYDTDFDDFDEANEENKDDHGDDIRYVEQIKDNIDTVAKKLKASAIRYFFDPNE